jgi:hypothetical protein
LFPKRILELAQREEKLLSNILLLQRKDKVGLFSRKRKFIGNKSKISYLSLEKIILESIAPSQKIIYNNVEKHLHYKYIDNELKSISRAN